MITNAVAELSNGSATKKRKFHSGKETVSNSDNIVLDEFVDSSTDMVNTDYIRRHNNELANLIDRGEPSPSQCLVEDATCKPVSMRSKQKLVENPLRLTGIHTPAFCKYVYQNPEDSSKTISFDKRKTCPVCHQRSNIYCLRCNVGLHIRTHQSFGCWEVFHSEEFNK